MASRGYYLLVAFCVTIATLDALDKKTVDSVRSKIRSMILNDPRDSGLPPRDFILIPGLLRLAFHDCVSKKCDGCINMKNADNAGLDVYINKVEKLYKTLKDADGKAIMSRADFWALGGIEAVTLASEFGVCPRCRVDYPKLTFQTGRKDCSGSPWTKDVHKFPDPLAGTKETTDFFKNQFGFTYMETVAIMGGHTLGQAHPAASGFARPWVERRFKFDNEYFKALVDTKNDWKQVRLGRPRFAKWQWESQIDRPKMMLNCDMSLLKNMTKLTSAGEVKGCTYKTCPMVDSSVANTAVWVKKFAKDNKLFVQKFSRAFQKMISHGYTSLKNVTSSSPVG